MRTLDNLISKVQINKDLDIKEEILKELRNYKNLLQKNKSSYKEGYFQGYLKGKDEVTNKLISNKEIQVINTVTLDDLFSTIIKENQKDKEVDIFSIIEECCNNYEIDKEDFYNYILEDNNYLNKLELIFKSQGYCVELHKSENVMELF